MKRCRSPAVGSSLGGLKGNMEGRGAGPTAARPPDRCEV